MLLRVEVEINRNKLFTEKNKYKLKIFLRKYEINKGERNEINRCSKV